MAQIKFILFASTILIFSSASANRQVTPAELQAICAGQTPRGIRIISDAATIQAACTAMARRNSSPQNTAQPAPRDTSNPNPVASPAPAAPQNTAAGGAADATSPDEGETQSASPQAQVGSAEIAPPTPQGAASDPQNPCSDRGLTASIPSRQGQDIPNFNRNMGVARDNQVVSAVRSGNIPEFLQNLRPVQMQSSSCMGSSQPITLCVMPDYLAVGDDSNYVHTPIGIDAATQIAGELGFLLPTTRMVDAIYAQGQARVAPSTRTPDGSMTTASVFTEHSRAVQQSFAGRENLLRVGHKKDVVMTNRGGGVPIYGWHRTNGRPIQSLYTGHGRDYSDYSHGVRLISQTAFIGGQSYSLASLLRDPACAQALSSEGQINSGVLQRYPAPNRPQGQTLPRRNGEGSTR